MGGLFITEQIINVEKIDKLGYGYIVYNYDSKENRLTQILRKEGKINEEEEERVNCLLCRNNINNYRKDIILFELKKEEYIMWLYEQLKTKKYKHGGYTTFYVTKATVCTNLNMRTNWIFHVFS